MKRNEKSIHSKTPNKFPFFSINNNNNKQQKIQAQFFQHQYKKITSITAFSNFLIIECLYICRQVSSKPKAINNKQC